MNGVEEGMINPFAGSNLAVTRFFIEDDIDMQFDFGGKEDENERYILYLDGTLIKKTKSSVIYKLNRS